jgi:beta-1,2-mannosidase
MKNLLLVCLLMCFSSLWGQKIPTHFVKPPENPILRPDSSFSFLCPIKNQVVKWQKAEVFNPAAIVKDGKIMLLFRAEDNPKAHLGGRTSRIGLAESTDGLHFKIHPQPVLFPDNDAQKIYDSPGGCEDPRLVQTEDGWYIMAYTAWNFETARLCIAFSRDLIHWEKKGPAFAKAYEGRFLNDWSKSASMITRMVKGKQVLAKIQGKYWMYWGENRVNLAWSENGYDWTPTLDEQSKLKALISPRPHFFDSHLTECGPPALWTKRGVVLLYNGKNAGDVGADPALPRNTYSVGRVVFDPLDLQTVLERSAQPFLVPTLPHEITGQYQAGTTFAEGLVYFKKKWRLYYGTADSFVGLAIGESVPRR